MEWYRRAAEEGDAEAQLNMGNMHANGKGVVQDYGQAVKWYRRAAEQGLAEAQHNLGVMYSMGEGVVEDYVTAHMWVSVGWANGHNSGELLEFLEKLMTKDQIVRSQQRASDCLANQYKNC